jgi:hypothetical protein
MAASSHYSAHSFIHTTHSSLQGIKMKNLLVCTSALIASIASGAAMSAAYKVVDVVDGGSVSGKITFVGDDPAAKIYSISKDNDVCGEGKREVDYVRVNDGALQNAIVYLDKVKSGKEFNEEEQNAALDQKGCEFHPFLQVMHNGHELEALNSDSVSHNIHTYEIIGKAKKTVMNISQPKQDSVITKEVSLKRGTHMKVECDQHDFMHGFVFVAKSHYYAVVAEDGSYTISDVPAGKYTVKAWHGTLGEQKSKVEVAAGGEVTADFEYEAK